MTGTSFIPAIIVAIIVVRTKKIINRFKLSGTTTPHTAKTAGELNIRENLIFRKLVRRNVLIEVSPGRYYLHNEHLEDYLRARRMRILLAISVIIILILIDILFIHYIP
jgi:hypothetical protein